MSEKLSEMLEALCAIKGRPFTVAERAESLILMSRAAAVLRAVEGAVRYDVREAFCGGRVGWIEGSLPERYIGEVAVIPTRDLVPLDASGSAEGVEGG